MQAESCVATAERDGEGPPTSAAAEEFLCRFGDAIDDRVADILDERDTLRPRTRLRPGFAAIALLLAVIATILLRHTPVAACAVWLSTAVVCLAVSISRTGRP
jgi:hypothetical protein